MSVFRVHAGSVGFENRLRLRRNFYKFLPIANSENLGYLHQAAAVETPSQGIWRRLRQVKQIKNFSEDFLLNLNVLQY